MLRSCWVAVALIIAAAAPAFAEDQNKPPETWRPAEWRGSTHVVAPTPLDGFTPRPVGADVSPYIYLNRCTGGCMIQQSMMNDARTNLSTIPKMGSGCPGYPNCVVEEFRNGAGQTGAAADAEWNALVQCMKEVYSPFAVQVVTERPANVSYTMAVIAGRPGNVGLGDGILGIAPLAGDCSAQDNVISFSFANHHGNTDRVNNLCWTAAQETAHALGLDHEFVFSDGTSACNDPMTYRFDCGGQKFFRNKAASCGEMEVRACQCGGSQNSHLKILGVFGEGTSLIPPPTVVINTPMNNSVAIPMQIVGASAGSKRGVEKVELFLNGYKWATEKGAAFGGNGQLNPSNYVLRFPGNVPDGVIDIVVKASDDLGIATSSSTVTVTKGQPCASAASCLEGQKCDAGKCFWDPPVGKLGEACDYPQFCESGVCVETTDGGLCSQDCIVGVMDSCPMGYYCEAVGAGGACIEEEDPGCCNVGGTRSQLWMHGGLAALIFGFVVRRRRKR